MLKFICLALLIALPQRALASHHSPHAMPGMTHEQHMAAMAGAASEPQESGQSAFAAIAEIAAILEADPNTDWSKVDVEGLRQHLIDMNNVTLGAVVSSETIAGGLRYSVSGEGAVRASIQRMLTAHAAIMNGVGGMHFSIERSAQGAVLSVTTAANPDRLKGLGFIGLLSMGMHHQQHHMMIARGNHPHQ